MVSRFTSAKILEKSRFSQKLLNSSSWYLHVYKLWKRNISSLRTAIYYSEPINYIYFLIASTDFWPYLLLVGWSGDNNFGDDMLLYAPGQLWLNRHHIMGRAVRWVDIMNYVLMFQNWSVGTFMICWLGHTFLNLCILGISNLYTCDICVLISIYLTSPHSRDWICQMLCHECFYIVEHKMIKQLFKKNTQFTAPQKLLVCSVVYKNQIRW